jgi:hypothetical protein
MLGCKVEDVLMGRIAQKRAALYAAGQRRGAIRDIAPWGDETADVEAPVGMEILDDPIVALHRGQWLPDVSQMGDPIRTGTGRPEMPDELARGHHTRGQ